MQVQSWFVVLIVFISKPKFIKKLTVRMWLKAGNLKGSELDKAVDRLKKQRQRNRDNK